MGHHHHRHHPHGDGSEPSSTGFVPMGLALGLLVIGFFVLGFPHCEPSFGDLAEDAVLVHAGP